MFSQMTSNTRTPSIRNPLLGLSRLEAHSGSGILLLDGTGSIIICIYIFECHFPVTVLHTHNAEYLEILKFPVDSLILCDGIKGDAFGRSLGGNGGVCKTGVGALMKRIQVS